MTTNNEIIKQLNTKLNSALKQKRNIERDYQKLRHMELIKSEELETVVDESEQLKQSLNELKDQICVAQKQFFKTELLKLSTEMQIKNYKQLLEDHKIEFEDLFQREKEKVEIHYKALKEREEAELKKEREKQKQLAEANEKQLKEAMTLEAECDDIEMDCTVLNVLLLFSITQTLTN
ncbi:hypothetical protein EVAR_13979_1 [Eumeta japonica]|uniref:Uncharacterized protein n=1 Tax=Eumeta variegata TaxID=151549 RepID=A0A4C1U8T6_EUMVA|nr:hypothetical protein EVAR_13979_1 [Eumeta japonica]